MTKNWLKEFRERWEKQWVGVFQNVGDEENEGGLNRGRNS